ncbi:hypothetical protein D3C76_753390 [compost metagenome]
MPGKRMILPLRTTEEMALSCAVPDITAKVVSGLSRAAISSFTSTSLGLSLFTSSDTW